MRNFNGAIICGEMSICKEKDFQLVFSLLVKVLKLKPQQSIVLKVSQEMPQKYWTVKIPCYNYTKIQNTHGWNQDKFTFTAGYNITQTWKSGSILQKKNTINILDEKQTIFTTCIGKTGHVVESGTALLSTDTLSPCDDRTHEAPSLDDGKVYPTLYSSQDPCRVDMDLPLPVSW